MYYSVVVDGFPRTRVQVEAIKQLQDRMADLHKEFFHTDLSAHFPRPKFHVVMLYIAEEESIKRQMARGEKVAIHNAQVRTGLSGTGDWGRLGKTGLEETRKLALRVPAPTTCGLGGGCGRGEVPRAPYHRRRRGFGTQALSHLSVGLLSCFVMTVIMLVMTVIVLDCKPLCHSCHFCQGGRL